MIDDAGSKKTLAIGIMGGMGPQATVHFFSELVRLTDAKTDQDHLQILINNNPQIPNRHLAISGKAPSVGPDLAEMARGLEESGADFVVLVCNTAHAFQADIEAALSIPFVSIIDEVVKEIREVQPGTRRVGVMAAEGCLEAGLYQNALKSYGLEPVLWDDDQLSRFMTLVFEIKAGKTGEKEELEMMDLARALEARGAELLISGCTEIPLVLDADKVSLPLLSSSDLLIRNTIAYATGQRPLP